MRMEIELDNTCKFTENMRIKHANSSEKHLLFCFSLKFDWFFEKLA